MKKLSFSQMKRTALYAFAASTITVFAILPDDARAHPHVWTSVQTEILYGPSQEIVGFRQHWTFDEMYSSFAIQGLDTNGDGVYERAELHSLATENVNSLKDFGYFTFPEVNGQKLPLDSPKDYWLDYNQDRLTLHFTMPLARPLAPTEKKGFSFAIYDPSMYVAFQFAEVTPVKLAGSPPSSCEPRLKLPEPSAEATRLSEAFFSALDTTSDFAAQFATTVTVECKS